MLNNLNLTLNMKIYDYGKTKNCLICGCIDGNIDKFIKIVIGSLYNLKSYVVETHPKEIERQERLAKKKEELNRLSGHMDLGGLPHIQAPRPLTRFSKKMKPNMNSGYNLTETLIIVDGYNGLGERDSKYYHDKLKMFNKVLADNNTHILFVRGSDDPKYFEDGLIDLSNIKTIQDYSVIKLNKFNCLCIGGCISLDRSWKKEQEKRIGRKMYWENEGVKYIEDDIKKIIKDYNIACVVTASCPSFAYPGMNSFKRSAWALKDKNLIKDITQERITMDKIYNKMMEGNGKPYVWAYSRFKGGSQDMINDILFKSLNSFEFLHFNNTVSTFFKVNFSETLKQNDFVSEGFVKKEAPSYHPFRMEEIENPFDNDGAQNDEEEFFDEDDEVAEGFEIGELGTNEDTRTRLTTVTLNDIMASSTFENTAFTRDAIERLTRDVYGTTAIRNDMWTTTITNE